MTVRITESRLPPGYLPSDLGQGVEVSGPGGRRYVLVGYLTSPLRLGALQEYVLFVIGAPADQYRWSITPPPGGPAVTITTQIGSMSNWYDELGTHELQVEVMEAGAVAATLTLTELVVAPEPALETRLGADKSHFADVERELGNDLAGYIRRAAEATGPTGIPTHLLTTILMQEGLARAAKRGSFGADQRAKSGDYEAIREAQADRLADAFEEGKPRSGVLPDGTTGVVAMPPIPRTLGPGSLALWTLASIVGSPPLTPWLEADTAGATFPMFQRRIVLAKHIMAFRGLPYLTQVDIFNLARFPKTSVWFVAQLLATLKNRPHRWRTTAREDVLADPHLLEIIGSEYRDGPTTTPAASARPNDYGSSTRKMARGEVLAFDLALLP